MKRNKMLSLLGLAAKAGKVVSGEFATEKAVKDQKAYFVIISEEASENTKKKFKNMCEYYKTEMFFYGNKEDLGKAIGKEFRASLAVTDANFAKAIQEQSKNLASE